MKAETNPRWNPDNPIEVTPEDYEKHVVSWLRSAGQELQRFTVNHLEKVHGDGGERTQVVNMIRSILHEFGHILPTGIGAVSKFAREHGTGERLEMPEIADCILGMMCHQLNGLIQSLSLRFGLVAAYCNLGSAPHSFLLTNHNT